MAYKDGIQREPSRTPEAHRELVVLDPPLEGEDVTALQRQARGRLKARGLLDDVTMPTHGKFTHATAVACAEVGYWLGARSDTYLATERVNGSRRLVCSIGLQDVIRDPDERTSEQLHRAGERQAALDDGPRLEHLVGEQAGGAGTMEAALKWAVGQAGVKESPPGSNWGGRVSEWIKLSGYVNPVPWCGCFANAVCVRGRVPNGAGWIGYTPAIIRHAQQKIGGWQWVGPQEGARGHLALFDSGPGGDPAVHVGVVLRSLGGGGYRTVEGNTSSGSGSQADGGMVAQRDRTTSRAGGFYIVGFAVPPWHR